MWREIFGQQNLAVQKRIIFALPPNTFFFLKECVVSECRLPISDQDKDDKRNTRYT